MMTPDDRTLLVETATNVKWIKAQILEQKHEISCHRKEIGVLKKYLYMALGAVGLLEAFAHLKR